MAWKGWQRGRQLVKGFEGRQKRKENHESVKKENDVKECSGTIAETYFNLDKIYLHRKDLSGFLVL